MTPDRLASLVDLSIPMLGGIACVVFGLKRREPTSNEQGTALHSTITPHGKLLMLVGSLLVLITLIRFASEFAGASHATPRPEPPSASP